MKKTTKEFWVEYDFDCTLFNAPANRIRIFRTREEAEAFAKTTKDGKVVEVEMTEQ